MLKSVFKTAADGAWTIQPFSGPLQLTWQWFPPQFQTIGPDQICTFGNLIKGQNFRISTYRTPNNFAGFLNPNQKMIIEVTADFDNGEIHPIFIQISWNGKWSDDTIIMKNNLVVKKVEKELLTNGSV